MDKALEEGVAIGMAGKRAPRDAALGLAADGIGDTTIKALDQAVGLRPIRSGQAVMDTALCAETIERVAAGGPIPRLVFHIDGEAVGELAAIVGKDGMNGMREVSEEALKESCRGFGITPGMDLQIDVARGAVDGDEGIAFTPLQRRQMLEIDMNEPDGCLLKDADGRPVRLGPLA
jgi:hypothetical protein